MKWLQWGRRDRELEEEIRAHLAMAARDRMNRGEPLEGAQRAARREFGNVALIQEVTRQMWGWRWLERLWQDLRYAARGMRRAPGFAAVAVASVALGIGANTAIFSLIDALMLKSLPVRDPSGLYQVSLGRDDTIESLSYRIVRAVAERKEIFSGVAGFTGWVFPVGLPGAIRNTPGALVTGDFFETLGLRPAAGRLLRSDDDERGAPPVAVISDGYWQRQFGGDPETIGRTIRVAGVGVTIVGITPRGFTGANAGAVADITMAVAMLPIIKPESAALLEPGNFWLRALARLRAGISVPQAVARLASVWPGLAERTVSPSWPPDRQREMIEARFTLKPGGTGWTYLRQIYRTPLLVLMGCTGLVLLIACANVAILLLSRATARQKEIAIRLAIGAGRPRIVRQLLTESALLSGMGAAIGLALAWVLSRALVNTISNGRFPMVFDLTPNGRVLAFATAAAIATALGFGLAPALQGASAAIRRRSRLLAALVSFQAGLSLLLLIGAGLFVRTLRNLENVDPGFQREGVLLVDLEGRRSTVPRDLVEAVARVPGVVTASISTHTPLSGSTWSDPAVPAGQPLPKRDNAIFIGAAPRFFETMQIRLLAGRDFSEHDALGAPRVAIVDEAYAQRYFSDRNPVGQHLAAMVRGKSADLEVVGVARKTLYRGLRRAPYPEIYVPYYQLPDNIPSTLEARVRGRMGQAAQAIQKEVQVKLPDSAIDVRPLSEQVEAAMTQERMLATLASGFGALALVLACIGLFGLLRYAVARRTREIGIRMALGAEKSGVIAMEMRRALRLVAAGIALGLPVVWIASRWVKSLLFGLAPTDPATMAGAAVLLVTAALGSAYVPARRASKVDPMTALREE
ncbi:MAG TPA: ABC transporter permease [Bryobacteraceae bacterium]|nr:ABC transporter permease [Bryobacteraceae bacterium]